VSSASVPVVILCGGEGVRFREETQFRPKPLVTVGGYPIVWHVMNLYASRGFTDFILCLGYKGSMIKEYFLNYEAHTRNFTIELGDGGPRFTDDREGIGWRVTLVDTGPTTMTGARLKRVERYIESDHLMVTYADGVADIDVQALLDFHLAHDDIATVTGVHPPLPFGEMVLDGSRVAKFTEKPRLELMINGGFFVFRREIFKYLDEHESCILERAPLERLAAERQLHAYRHDGFWQCLDTLKDHMLLEEIWRSGRVPWRPAR
jgi:glucose-1-phosphate cytidylyltransferase